MESKQQINIGGMQHHPESHPIEGVELLHVFDKMKAVKAFIFDIDGVLTNNAVLVTESGELLRTMNIRDGQAIKWARQSNYPICIITGGRSEGTKKRLLGLGIEAYYANITDKTTAFKSFLQLSGLLASEICYMGDDLPDLPVLRSVGLSCCPADAVPEIKSSCDFISEYNGGEGCVRDILERVMKLQATWPNY
jgi:3-deoxy-D-manno-octulosonate 8-phosphate phosphatase (KDO 8-P phosphatase)